jgi:hypothetical protein
MNERELNEKLNQLDLQAIKQRVHIIIHHLFFELLVVKL